MKYDQVEKLIDAVSKSDLTEFNFEEDGVKLSLKKEEKTIVVESQGIPAANMAGNQTVGAAALAAGENTRTPAGAVQTADKQPEAAGQVVKSPLVGTFYSAPSEDADAFVKVGDEVKVGQVLAIIEAMKLMNEIDSDFAGTVTEVLVQNGQAVEYGQPLFRIA
ncbi:MAG: acetyl-CoA carboxylase biotin carboxyl carrier protein [Hespellia sp.]|nr:acetyl-CoA carboxylase biotin carboxyl carrier protein [Hespellia sp.]